MEGVEEGVAMTGKSTGVLLRCRKGCGVVCSNVDYDSLTRPLGLTLSQDRALRPIAFVCAINVSLCLIVARARGTMLDAHSV